jgi:sarcosine/dimethylglycine N-methyltransferase
MGTVANGVAHQYATGDARERITRALTEAGMDPNHLDPQALALIEDFHSSGRIATAVLVELAEVAAEDRVLDAGTGIGGTARLLAQQPGCRVSAVDITAEYCEIARWLNAACGLDGKIEVSEGDVLDLPFAASAFDVVFSQHVQMNIADKDRLYAETRRVLAPGGRLALWDVVSGDGGELAFPVPWAERAESSHLVTAEQLATTLARHGFEPLAWNDLTEQSAGFMRSVLALPSPPPLGLHVFVPDFRTKMENLVVNLEQGRARLIQAVLR